MGVRKRRKSSFLLAEVMGRLRRLEPAEHCVAAGRAILHGSLALQADERLLVVFEAGFEELAAALAMAADEVDAPVDAISIGDPIPPRVVEKIERRLERTDVSVLIANVTFPREVRTPLVRNTSRRRHAHMLGVSDAVIRQSLRADYDVVDRLGGALIRTLEGATELHVESARGTDLTARPDRLCRWYNQGGLQHGPGWTNLPAGEVVTSPSRVDGRFIPDGGIWLTDGTLIDRGMSRRLLLDFDEGYLVGVQGPDAPRDLLWRHVDERREGRRVGQLSFGTNVGVLAPIGNPAQDAKLPGFHLVLGYSAPDVTGASWNGEAMVTLLQRQESVRIDGRLLIERGRYLAPLAP